MLIQLGLQAYKCTRFLNSKSSWHISPFWQIKYVILPISLFASEAYCTATVFSTARTWCRRPCRFHTTLRNLDPYLAPQAQRLFLRAVAKIHVLPYFKWKDPCYINKLSHVLYKYMHSWTGCRNCVVCLPSTTLWSQISFHCSKHLGLGCEIFYLGIWIYSDVLCYRIVNLDQLMHTHKNTCT